MSTKHNSSNFVFDRTNYIWMIVGIVVMAVGYLLMIGGASTDPAVFNADEKYSFVRITLSPALILIGLAIELFAIVKRDKNPDELNATSKVDEGELSSIKTK